MIRPHAEQIIKAEQNVVDAIMLIVEARKSLTLFEFESFVRGNISQLGGRGFLCSIGKAIVDGATLDMEKSSMQILTIEYGESKRSREICGHEDCKEKEA